ncbi:unnamed protein product [Medioppia subpectinata]|uniref:Uncharacterized protein n=1 Tax=Medioppia subpectinata TaxID=1979941 RepID=A0A7R9KH25_9ACAR|nr:unnamed protein product [Medioppia subpectinata]CAG2103419.1 unnamed protein product [Medioppia subpectinata]
MDFNARPDSRDNNHFYHYNASLSPPQQPLVNNSSGGQRSPLEPQLWTQNDYLSQYYSQYYRDYYRRFLGQQQLHQQVARATTTVLRPPLKYGSVRCHSRALFSQHDNSLVVVDNTRRRHVVLYSLRDLCVDYVYTALSPLIRDGAAGLPVTSRDACLQWLRSFGEFAPNFELKLVTKVMEMCLKQNRVEGHDLAELLLPHVLNAERLEQQFPAETASRNAFRALLLRGQRALALSHAMDANNGLMDHALALSYLLTTRDDIRRRKTTTISELMMKTVKKFCETLHPKDPLHVFYSSLSNEIQRKTRIESETSFEAFLILLSNEMDLKSIHLSQNDDIFPQLLSLIRHLVTEEEERETFILSDELFDSEMNSILLNESLEFCLHFGKHFNRKLVFKKVKLVSILFDFGFIDICLQYLPQLKTFSDNLIIRRIIYELESRFDRDVVPLDAELTTHDVHDVFADDASLHTSAQQLSFETTPEEESPSEQTRDIQTEAPLLEPQTPLPLNPGLDFYGQVVAPPPPPLVNNVYNSVVDATPSLTTESTFTSNDFSFISNSNSMPSMPFEFETNESAIRETTLNDTPLQQSSTTTAPKTTSNDLDAKDDRQKSSGLLSKLFNFRPKNQAILPDDSHPTLVYDKNLQQWVDTSAAAPNAAAPPPMAAPPVTAMGGAPPLSRKFEFNRNSKRYLDVTRIQ